jgi:CRISPR/Cas system CMR-associated protein Cmr5 small subunit
MGNNGSLAFVGGLIVVMLSVVGTLSVISTNNDARRYLSGRRDNFSVVEEYSGRDYNNHINRELIRINNEMIGLSHNPQIQDKNSEVYRRYHELRIMYNSLSESGFVRQKNVLERKYFH